MLIPSNPIQSNPFDYIQSGIQDSQVYKKLKRRNSSTQKTQVRNKLKYAKYLSMQETQVYKKLRSTRKLSRILPPLSLHWLMKLVLLQLSRTCILQPMRRD